MSRGCAATRRPVKCVGACGTTGGRAEARGPGTRLQGAARGAPEKHGNQRPGLRAGPWQLGGRAGPRRAAPGQPGWPHQWYRCGGPRAAPRLARRRPAQFGVLSVDSSRSGVRGARAIRIRSAGGVGIWQCCPGSPTSCAHQSATYALPKCRHHGQTNGRHPTQCRSEGGHRLTHQRVQKGALVKAPPHSESSPKAAAQPPQGRPHVQTRSCRPARCWVSATRVGTAVNKHRPASSGREPAQKRECRGCVRADTGAEARAPKTLKGAFVVLAKGGPATWQGPGAVGQRERRN